jgi:hypothetical protein
MERRLSVDNFFEIVSLHFFALVFSVIGYVYSQVLTEGGMIFNWLWVFLEKRLPNWLFKPVMDCYKCVCGQISLWTGFYFVNYSRPLIEIISLHAYFICLTILISILINEFYQRIKGY